MNVLYTVWTMFEFLASSTELRFNASGQSSSSGSTKELSQNTYELLFVFLDRNQNMISLFIFRFKMSLSQE